MFIVLFSKFKFKQYKHTLKIVVVYAEYLYESYTPAQ